MTDDRIIDIFEAHGQYVTGKDYAMIRAIAEAVSPQRTWVGLTWEEVDECFKITPDQYLPAQIYKRIEAKLKEKNT